MWTSSMLEGDIPQDKMTCLFFCKGRYQKMSDLSTVIGNNTIYLNRWHLFTRMSSVEQELEPQKIDKCRMRPCPKGQVTVSEQILSLANPAHSGLSTQRTRGTNWQYQLTRARVLRHEKRCATVASLSLTSHHERAIEVHPQERAIQVHG